MSGPPQRPVVIVCGLEQDREIAPLVADLLDHEWDAHVVCEGGDPARVLELASLSVDARRERLHPPPRHLRRAAPRPALLTGALRAAGRRPHATVRQLLVAPSSLARYLQAVVLALDPALVHFPALESADRHGGLLAALNGRVRTVASVSGHEENSLVLDEAPHLNAVLARMDGLHLESDDLAAVLRSRGFDRLMAVIPEAAAIAPAQPAERREGGDTLHVLTCAQLNWAEGYEHAVHAVALLARSGVPCLYRIVGSGEFVDAIRFARHQLDVEERVEIVEDGSMAEHLAWADVAVSAAVVPRSSRWLRDAQAAGVPLVVTERRITPEGALAVPKRDPHALAASLARLAADPDLRRRLGAAGRDAVADRISVAERASRFRELYWALLSA